MKLFEKKEKKKKSAGPGHLKERNHFDGKDMILLVVCLIIIYGIMTWVQFFAEEAQKNREADPQTTIESSIDESQE